MRPLRPRGALCAATTAVIAACVIPAAATAAEPLAPLAPALKEAGRLATLEADRAERPPRPEAVFPIRGSVDWGEYDARFGAWRGGRSHEGQDVFAPAGTPLVAIRDGRVVETGNDGGRGNYVAIWSPETGRTYVYLHMLRPASHRPGERVRAGRRVGAVGCTGSCWGDHLHLEVRRGRGTTGAALDPLPLLRRLATRRPE